MSDDFYKNLTGFEQFSALSDPSHYTPAPADWHVVATDVKNSTIAIEQGKYKEINLSGAAVIIAILNIAKDTAIPYAFGGDGATMLVPGALVESALAALAAVQAKVKQVFGLELRAGCIPIQALYDTGATLMVAKFFLSPHISQAVFQGHALALAERWLKKGGGTVRLSEPVADDEPNLEGLECRWQPLRNRHGKIISLLVKVAPQYDAQAWQIYADILKDIEAIYPQYADACPVSKAALHLNLSPAGLFREATLRNPTLVSKMVYLLNMVLQNLVGIISLATGRTLLGFDGKRYLGELVANSDARKFDEMLRMVLDSTQAQHEALEKVLHARRAKGQIMYGIHESAEALMTCLVFSMAGNHVHLVDGADGGYALAAKQLKQQIGAAG